MKSLVIFLVVLGVFLPSTLGADDECSKNPDGKVDWTKEDSTWYYCQTSQPKRKSNNCYVTFTKGDTDGDTNAATYSYDLEDEAKGVDKFLMRRITPGSYNYIDRGTTAMNVKVSEDGNCLTYWKCHGDKGNWNGIPGSGAYFMFMCKNPTDCKKNGEYDEDKQKIINELKDAKNFKIFDLDQGKCDQLNIKPQ